MRMYDYVNRSVPVIVAACLIFIASALLVPIVDSIERENDAPVMQDQGKFEMIVGAASPQTVPGSGSAYSLFMFPTTLVPLAATPKLLNQQGGDQATPTSTLTGPTSLYAPRADGATPCFINFYDYSTAAQVTPGTTNALTSISVVGSSTVNQQPGNLPTLNFQNGVVVSASTTPNGTTNCSTSPYLMGWYKR